MRLPRQVRLLWPFGAASLCLACSGCGDAPALQLAAPSLQKEATGIVAGSRDMPDYFAATGALIIATQQNAAAVRTRLCTATLIAADAVITAAHCKVERATMGLWRDGQPLIRSVTRPSPKDLTLRGAQRAPEHHDVWYSFCLLSAVSPAAGVTQNSSPQCTPISAFEAHPDYQLPGPWDLGLVDAYDVAILRLARPVAAPAPAALLQPAQSGILSAKTAVSIAGYGSTSDHAALGPLTQASGVKRFARSAIGRLSAAEMTVGEPPCPAHKSFGDSGGPTFVDTPDGPRLAGVTSRLQADADAGLGTVDTRLDAVATWIRETADIAGEPNTDDIDEE